MYFPFKVKGYPTARRLRASHEPVVSLRLWQATAAGAKAHEAMNWLEKRVETSPDPDDNGTVQMAIMCLQHVRCLETASVVGVIVRTALSRRSFRPILKEATSKSEPLSLVGDSRSSLT
jgi:20S proteasome alpha/beta subunit